MGEVAEALGLSRAGVTSTINRLVADGLVLRERGGRRTGGCCTRGSPRPAATG